MVDYLEAKFSLQYAVERLAVLAAIRVVNPVVGAHDVSSASVHGILEWPVMELDGRVYSLGIHSYQRYSSCSVTSSMLLD